MTLAEIESVVRGFARSRGVKVDVSSDDDYLEALAAFEAAGMA